MPGHYSWQLSCAVSDITCWWLCSSQHLLGGPGGVLATVDLLVMPPGASSGHSHSESGSVMPGCFTFANLLLPQATWSNGKCLCTYQGWSWMVFKVPPNSNHSGILWSFKRSTSPVHWRCVRSLCPQNQWCWSC